jgi:hypothetical protein
MTDTVPTRGSLHSRGAALVSALTLRQISAVLPPEQAWGLWLSRRIVAGIMEAFGPSLAGTTGGGSCEPQVRPDQVHVFQALPRLSPEAATAMARVARFVDTSLRADGVDVTTGKAG